MAKISFNKLGLKKDSTIDKVIINGMEIEVKKYLPLEDKGNIIDLVAQASVDNGVVNPILVEQYLHLYVVYKYTNLSFSEANRKDEMELYDILEANGLIDEVVNAIGEDYTVLRQYCEDYLDTLEKFNSSFYGVAINLLNNLPSVANEAFSSLDSLDLSKLKETFQIATEVGGNPAAVAEHLLG